MCNNGIIDNKITFKIIIQGKDYSLVGHDTVEPGRISCYFTELFKGIAESSEISVVLYQTALSHIPQDRTTSHRQEDQKSYKRLATANVATHTSVYTFYIQKRSSYKLRQTTLTIMDYLLSD